MFGGSDQPHSRGTSALITGLTVLALGVMAAAIPPARLEPKVPGVERGYLVSSGAFSDLLAEFLNGNGYTYMAIDLTHMPLRDGEIWRRQFDRVSRIFPVWGWVDVRADADQATKVAAAVPLSGLYLYGAKPSDVEAVRAAKPGLTVVPVVRAGTPWTGKGEVAIAYPASEVAEAAKAKLPVLRTEGLPLAERAAARAALPGNYLIAGIPLLD